MNHTKLKCSVILPTHNRYYSIKYAIQSVLRQTYKNWELMIIDDCSLPQISKNIANHIQELDDSRIVYHRLSKSLGTSRARNIGIKLSTGEILLMAEDDIWFEEHCMEETIKTLVDKKADAACFKMKFIKDLIIGKEYNPHVFYPLTRSVVHSNVIPYVWHDWLGEMSEGKHSSKHVQVEACPGVFALRRDVLEKVGHYDEGYVGNYYREETDLQRRICQFGFKIIYTPNTFCFHFKFRRSMGGSRAMSLAKYEYFLLKNHFRFLKKFYCRRVLPMFVLFVLYRYLYYVPRRILNYKHVKKLKVMVFPFP